VTRLFLRCDDVAGDTDGLAAVADVLRDVSLPCAWACIPKRLTADAVDRLAAVPGTSLHQHGWSHERIQADGTDTEDELPGYADLGAQRDALRRGRQVMTDLVGGRAPECLDLETFTPPRHRYDRDTLTILRELGVRRLSAGIYHDLPSRVVYAVARRLGVVSIGGRGVSAHDRPSVAGEPSIVEVSVSVNIDLARDGSPRDVVVDEVLREIEDAERRTSTVGLLLHHETYTGRADRADALRRLLDAVATRWSVVDLRTIG
jgi:peptidoglycan/xylan/chitin deacetylase (PgdA/CDA1 family)